MLKKSNRPCAKSTSKNFKSILLGLLMASGSSAALAGSVGVPTQFLGIPPTDLMENSHAVNPDALSGEAERNAHVTNDKDRKKAMSDLLNRVSDLNPYESNIWKNQKFPLSDVDSYSYPADGGSVHYLNEFSSSSHVHRSLVEIGSGNDTKSFQMFVSLRTHTALTAAALMRKLGYTTATPKSYKNLTVKFDTIEARDGFLNEIADQNQECRGRWMKYVPKNADEAKAIQDDPCKKAELLKPDLAAKPEVTLEDVILQPGQIKDYTAVLHWGVMQAPVLKGRRQIRALLAVLALADISENVNIFAYEMATILSNSLVFNTTNVPDIEEYGTVSITDIMWIAKRMANLSRQDFVEIAEAANFPHDDTKPRPNNIEALVTEKLIGRLNQFMKLLKLKPSQDLSYNDRITTGDVKNGKLLVQRYPGYSSRFTIDDPQSPLRTDELTKLFQVEATSSALGQLFTNIKNNLQLATTQDAANQHGAEVRADCIRQIETKGFCENRNKIWGGPLAGFDVEADRAVVTGTYYGDDAKVSLVDTMSVTANAGYFLTKDGLPKIAGIPMTAFASGNLSTTRSYTHVRPIASMSEATRANWGDLYVKGYMDTVADSLKIELSTDPTATKPSTFLEKMKEGEMFIVTDSVSAGAQGGLTIPLAGILNVGIIGVNPALSFSGGVQHAIIRRTTFTRTSDGLYVYMQRMNSDDFTFNMNFNFWMQVYSYSDHVKKSKSWTKAYKLGATIDDDKRKPLAIALQALLKSNKTSMLEGEFGYYELDGEMTSRLTQGRILWFQWMLEDEELTMKIRRPAPNNTPDKERTAYFFKMARTEGSNKAAFLNDILAVYAKGWSFLSSPGSSPADTFFGKGTWAIWKSEAELTPWNPKPTGIVSSVEHHWGGWLLSKSELEKIVSSIEEKLKPVKPTASGWKQKVLTKIGDTEQEVSSPLVDMSVFSTTTQLQFYEIVTKFLVYEGGIQKLIATLTDPSLNNEDLHQRMVDIETGKTETGIKNFGKWCSGQNAPALKPGFFSKFQPTPLTSWGSINNDSIWSATDNFGNRDSSDENYYCVKPWMKWVLTERKKVPKERKELTKWSAQFLRSLETSMPFNQLADMIGPENYLFQVRISGFRKGDPNGDTAYQSSTLGTYNEKAGSGIFSEIATKEKLMPSVVSGSSMSLGR